MKKQVSQTFKWKLVPPITGVRHNRTLTAAIANQPRLLPWSSFQTVVAIFHWFKPADSKANHHILNTSSLRNFSQTTVPLEYTGPDPTNPAAKVFRRFHAPLSVFLDYIENPPQNVHIYLAQCSLKDLPDKMRRDLPLPEFLKVHARRPKAKGKPAALDVYDSSLWIGLPPTCTPLHRDPNANCFFQMAGEKTVRLLPPEKGLELFQRVKKRIGEGEGDLSGRIRGEEMMMGKEKEELEREVWDSAYDPESGGLEARLSRGEGLFIPEGWWHSVRGHGSTVTASVNWWFRLHALPEAPTRPFEVVKRRDYSSNKNRFSRNHPSLEQPSGTQDRVIDGRDSKLGRTNQPSERPSWVSKRIDRNSPEDEPVSAPNRTSMS